MTATTHRTIADMLAEGMNPEAIWDALEARPIPSYDLDLSDWTVCVRALAAATVGMHAKTDTREKREAIMRAVAASMAFGFFVGKLAERLNQCPAIEAMVRIGGGRNEATT